MLGSVLSGLKQIRSLDFVRKTEEKIHAEAIVGMARKAFADARHFTEDEMQALRGRLNLDTLGRRTSQEIERIVQGLADKLVISSGEQVSQDVRDEIANMIHEFNADPKKVISGLRYLNDFLVASAPRSLDDVRNLKGTLAHRLIADAQKRIDERGTSSPSQNAAQPTQATTSTAQPQQTMAAAPQETDARSEGHTATDGRSKNHGGNGQGSHKGERKKKQQTDSSH